jgi:SNF2 family DNA or RNA helicase
MTAATVAKEPKPLTLADILDQIKVRNLKAAQNVHLKVVPEPHQISGFSAAIRSDNLRYGLYDDPGLGKSLVSYLFLAYYLLQGNRALVLMPPILLTQYVEEFQRMLEFRDSKPTMHILNESPAARKELYAHWNSNLRRNWPRVLLMSYQLFLKIRGELALDLYDVLIADESHALKEPTSGIHQAVAEFLGPSWLRDGKAFLSMTGTVMPTDIGCAYGMIKLVSPNCYHDKRAFEREHAVKVLDSYGKAKIVAWKNYPELTRKLYRNGRRKTIDEVLPMNRPTIIETAIDLHPKHLELYRKLLTERMLEFEDGSVLDATQVQALRMHARKIIANPDEYSDSPIKNHVHLAVDQLLDSIGTRENKVIIFAWFQMTIEALAARYKDLNPAVIYGGSNTEKNKRKFLEDPSCRVALINPDSGGMGLNFQGVCCTEIFAEALTTPKSFEQGIARVARKGQTRPVRVYPLRVRGTVSTHMMNVMLKRVEARRDVLLDKKTVFDMLLGRE